MRPEDPQEPRGQLDPDIDVAAPGQEREWSAYRWTLPAIALGGMVGASARHGLELALPVAAGGFAWATFVTNVVGCLLLAVLMVVVVERGAGHPLLRPFAGTGVLGGFTTFSTYAVQTTTLADGQHPAVALVYLFGTLAAALGAVAVGLVSARSLLARREV